MKFTNIINRFKSFVGAFALAGMFLFSACDSERRETADNETGIEMSEDGVATTDTEYDRTTNEGTEGTNATVDANNTSANMAQRNYDSKTMGTAASNRKAMPSEGEKLSDADFQKLRQEYSDVNKEIRETLRQNTGASMRYTDDNRTSDFNYGNYGVYYDDVSDENARKQFKELEERRSNLQNQMRGKMDPTTKTFTSAEMDAVPAKGYDALYDFIDDQIEYPQNAAAGNIEGTIFVEFTVGPNGDVSSPTVVETIDGQREPVRSLRNPTRLSEDQRVEAIKAMEKEAIKVVDATDGMWEPARQGNQMVAQTVQLPVRFRVTNRP